MAMMMRWPMIQWDHPDYPDCSCQGLEEHIPIMQAVSAGEAAITAEMGLATSMKVRDAVATALEQARCSDNTYALSETAISDLIELLRS